MVAAHEHFRPSIKEVFRQPKKPVDVSHFWPNNKEAQRPSIFSLNDTYHHYATFRDSLSPAQASERIYWRTLMDLRAIRFEATAQPLVEADFPLTDDIVTRVSRDSNGQLTFSNRNHADGENLVDKYRRSTRDMSGYQRQRYAWENEQTIEVWKTASGILLNQEFSTTDSPAHITDSLLSQGFFKTEQTTSDGIISSFPHIEQISGSKKIEMVMGPPLITASPPTELHSKGKSSFMWVTRLVYLPAVNEFIVLQKGLFSGYQLPEVNFFLSYPDRKTTPFPTEEAILAFINHLPPEFVAQHAEVIFDEIIENLGHFTALPPIDKNIKLGQLNLSDYARTVLQLLEWEYQNCQKNPALLSTMPARFKDWEETILHSVVGGFDLNLDKLVASYVEMFEDPAVAAQPQDQAEKINETLNFVYPSRAINLDLSFFDCVSGTRFLGGSSLSTGIQLETNAMQLLEHARKHGINTQEELEVFCKAHHLPIKLFHKNGDNKKCLMCKEVTTFIGPCACPVCHAEDNLGLHGKSLESDQKSEDAVSRLQLVPKKKYRQRASVTQLLSNDIFLPEIEPEFELQTLSTSARNLTQAKAA